MVKAKTIKTEQPRAGWRFRLGLTILIVGWLSPLLIPVVTRTSLATEWKAIISGLLAVGIPEVFTVAAIAIMGKSGYNLIKERIFSFLKRHGPPDRVSLTIYRIGLVMFVLPFYCASAGWDPMGHTGSRIMRAHVYRETSSVMWCLSASLFVLGGDFWDKVRSTVLIHQAKVQVAADKSKLI